MAEVSFDISLPPRFDRETFSFYLKPDEYDLAASANDLAHGLTLRGPNGPKKVRAWRSKGMDVAALFDREGYREEPGAVDAADWRTQQVAAGASTPLSPGRWVAYDKHDPANFLRTVSLEAQLALDVDVRPLLAIDHRWFKNEPPMAVEQLAELGQPLFLLIAHRGDPLADLEVLEALRHLIATAPEVSFLRTDHGGVGLAANGAHHASIGLISSHRHLVPPGGGGGGGKRNDYSPRVFLPEFLDWFTINTIAGWSLVDPSWLLCHLPCCGGQRLDRLFDPDLKHEVKPHNLHALSSVANRVLNAGPSDRMLEFAESCEKASDRYDLPGMRGPKRGSQLDNWVLGA